MLLHKQIIMADLQRLRGSRQLPFDDLKDLKSNETNISGEVEKLVMKYNRTQMQKQRDMKVRDVSAAARYGSRYNVLKKRDSRPKTANSKGGYYNAV